MNDSMFLDDDELTGLTECHTNWGKVNWLAHNKVPYRTRPDGSPAVKRDEFHKATENKDIVSIVPYVDDIMALHRLPVDVCGVYFLWLTGKIVYVGMSRSIFSRIAQHRSGDKVFDRFSFIEVPPDDLPHMEQEMIAKFRPIYNVLGNKEKDNLLGLEVCDEDQT